MFKINVVEDEKHLNQLVASYLKKEGYEVASYYFGEEALAHMRDNVHLWVLDIMLPDLDGFTLLKKIKEHNKSMPVVFMSARDQAFDKILGLELGSDDYITKPFDPRELVLRVKKLLERVYEGLEKSASPIMWYEDYKIDLSMRLVFNKEKELNLSSKEFDLLHLLVGNKQKAYSREEILNAVWGNDYFGSDRVVDDLMRRLRKKMPDLKVETIYGYGYRLL